MSRYYIHFNGEKKQKVVFIAVVAAVIVAAPLSFYEYDQLHVIHLPLVLSTNSTTSGLSFSAIKPLTLIQKSKAAPVFPEKAGR